MIGEGLVQVWKGREEEGKGKWRGGERERVRRMEGRSWEEGKGG